MKKKEFQMLKYHELIIYIEELCNKPRIINCHTCKYHYISKYIEPCYSCTDCSNHIYNEERKEN